MNLHIVAALIAALLALTGVSAEDETLSRREVVTEQCIKEIDKDDTCDPITSTPPPSELPGPRETGGLSVRS